MDEENLEGNASGIIVDCDRPREIALTWEFGGGTSDVQVRLTLVGDDRTELELTHSPVPTGIATNAGETWGLGAGWETGLAALGEFLADRMSEGRAVDRMAHATPEELATFGKRADEISAAWAAVITRRTG